MKILTVAAAIAASLSLAACTTSSAPGGGAPAGGGTGTGTGTGTGNGTGTGTGTGTGGGTASPTDYDTAHSAAVNRAPTMEAITGTASYAGQMAVLTPGTNPAGSGRVTNDDDTVIGDLEMTVDFNPGVTNPVDARASNFSGRVGGDDVTVDGELTSAHFLSNGGDPALNMVNTSTTSAPVVGDITATSVQVAMSGRLSDASGTSGMAGDVEASLLGPVVGPAGATGSGDPAAIHGAANVMIRPDSGGVETAGGTFYVNRK